MRGPGYLLRGLGLWRTRPGLMLLGMVPALLVLLLVVGGLVVLLLQVGPPFIATVDMPFPSVNCCVPLS